MYIHYAEIQLPAGQFVQLKFCSYSYGQFNRTTQKNQFHISKKDWSEVVAPLVAFIKQIPSSDRAFDVHNNVWTIPIANWLAMKPIAEAGFKCNCLKWADLFQDFINADFDTFSNYNSLHNYSIPKPEDFFYEQPPVNQNSIRPTAELSLKDIELKLIEFFAVPDLTGDLKKLYRRAAMKYHPDLNNGDSTKMSELNWLWQEYQKIKG